MDDFIKGKINNDQYKILNEKLSEYQNKVDKDYDKSKGVFNLGNK